MAFIKVAGKVKEHSCTTPEPFDAGSQGLGSLVITSVALLAVVYRIIVGRDLRHGGDPGSATEVAGLAGLALSYALPIVGSLQGLLSSFTETEKEMVAVERIEEYVNTPGEASKGDPRTGGGTEQWPASGTIDIQSLTLRYRPSLPPALRDVSLHIPGGAKVWLDLIALWCEWYLI